MFSLKNIRSKDHTHDSIITFQSSQTFTLFSATDVFEKTFATTDAIWDLAT
jgi:hypothetical protein